MKNKILSYWTQVIVVSVATCCMVALMLYVVPSLPAFSSLKSIKEFELPDMYNSVLNSRAVVQKSDVVVIDIHDLSRYEIGDLVEIIGMHNPKAVGMDVLFAVPSEQDPLLFEQLESCPNLVLANFVENSSIDDEQYYVSMSSYFSDYDLNIHYGAINLCAESIRDVVRKYQSVYPSDSGYYLSLAAQMALLINPDFQPSIDQEYIYYPSVEIEQLSGRDILNGFYGEVLDNGIIMIGDLYDVKDIFSTPIGKEIPGVVIHAYSLHTMLANKHITSTPRWLDWLIAIIFCIAFVCYHVWLLRRNSMIRSLIMRVVQVFIFCGLFYMGLIWFRFKYQYIGFSIAMMVIPIEMLSTDIYYAILALIQKIKSKLIKTQTI